MSRFIYSLLFCFYGLNSLVAQLDLPMPFVEKLKAANIELVQPLENNYQTKTVEQHDHMPYDMAMWSGKEKLEIRYRIEPFSGTVGLTNIPQIDFMTRLTNVATNETALSDIAVHRFSKREIQEQFNADWGMMAFFKPKKTFSTHTHCKMMALYKENEGMVYVFFLFDDAENKALEYRANALRFY